MKVTKLDGRHNLYRKGYCFAFKFNTWSNEANKIETLVKKLEGFHYNCTFWAKPRGNSGNRCYYIGVKKESTVSIVLLSIN